MKKFAYLLLSLVALSCVQGKQEQVAREDSLLRPVEEAPLDTLPDSLSISPDSLLLLDSLQVQEHPDSL